MKWKVYQHALVPSCFPHENEEFLEGVAEIRNNLKLNKCYFARYVTSFDCNEFTEWYFIVKDTPLDISLLKANRRAIITKGLRHFSVKIIDPFEYRSQLYCVLQESLEVYPAKYRVFISDEQFNQRLEDWKIRKLDCFGAFDKETGELGGYALAYEKKSYAEYLVVKTIPRFQKKQINAALAYHVCNKYLNEDKVKILYAGERNIRHETNYQEYLLKNFGFRLAYCKLNIVYRPWVGICVKVLFPLRKMVKKISSFSPLFYNISCVLRQEEIRRNFDK